MMKRLIAAMLVAIMALSLVPVALGETLEEMGGTGEFDEPKTMFVYTDSGRRLNVRSEPRVKKGNLLGRLNPGTKVKVLGIVVIDPDWVVIEYKKGPDGVGYVQRRYLVTKKPGKTPEQIEKEKKEAERKKNLEELNKQQASAKPVDEPFMVAVRATRASGWINFRVGPGVAAARITSRPGGRELKVIGETTKWYQAVDTVTGKTGYISKNYCSKLATPVKAEKAQMGKLSVNGEFALQGKLPEGYSVQLINTPGSRVNAMITSADPEKPVMQLTVVFNDAYATTERMNDLTEEELKQLELSFLELNDVEISYDETAYGTKLLIAREVGDDTDFVDIMSVYKGYFIEFVMTPNSMAANQTLTDDQIKMCIDFLSELDFVPVGFQFR